MNPATSEAIARIKQQLRSLMNGAVSASMHEKGLTYLTNFGVEYVRLRQLAAATEKSAALAQALWQEDCRECRILAALLYPVETFAPELAELWIEQMRFAEEAEMTTMNLFQYLPNASSLAFRWIADEREWFQVCGFHLLARLFGRGFPLNERSEREFLNQAAVSLLSPSLPVRRAAQTARDKHAALTSD